MISSFFHNLLISRKRSLFIAKSRESIVLSRYKCARSASRAFKAVRCSTEVALRCCAHSDSNSAKVSSLHKFLGGNSKLRQCDSTKPFASDMS